MAGSTKKLLVLGGTRIACEIVKCAQRMGVHTTVVDYYPPEKSPAKMISDAHCQISATDVDSIVSYIKENNINGVMVGFSDMLLPYYARICKISNLPSYGTEEQFKIFTNKKVYKKILEEFNIPTPKEYKIDFRNLQLLLPTIKYPVIVKPVDNAGARGITVCNDEKELMDAVDKAYGYSDTNDIVIEEYINGREVTVFWLFQDGNYYVTGIGNRHVKNNQEKALPLPAGYTYPANITTNYLKNVAPNVKKMLKSLDIKNGMMFMQCKVKNDICLVYDIGYRLTGSLEYKNIFASYGVNPMEMMINYALEGVMSNSSLARIINPLMGKYSFNISFLVKPGVIDHYEGLELLNNVKGFIDAVMDHIPGEEISNDMKGLLSQIAIRVFGIAENIDDMWKKIEYIQTIVKIISTNGDNMVLPGIEAEDLLFVESGEEI